MRIVDLRCAVIGRNPVVRVVTDEGLDGYGQIESTRPFLRSVVPMFRDLVVGEDPTQVERVMLKIRRLGGFKPWGSTVSAIEMALWDIAGKAAGLPVHRLLGGWIRDRVRVYITSPYVQMSTYDPHAFADRAAEVMAAPEGFTLIKQAVGFHHAGMLLHEPDAWYDEPRGGAHGNRGMLRERGLRHFIACVEAIRDVLGDAVALALDCGPGWTPKDAISFARALEPLGIAWLEDLISGDYTQTTTPDIYRDVSRATTVPIATGEQVYLRQGFKSLIETRAVDLIGPDPADIGGLAELKWVAEFADLYGILIAPHGIFDGLIGLAAHIQVAAVMPQNFVAFEYPRGDPTWWYEIVEGLPDPIVRDGFIEVLDRPGLGVTFNVAAARRHLADEDRQFFD